MEERIAKMEATVDQIDRNVSRMAPDLANVRERMATIEERVSHLPSKGYIVTATTISLVLVAALFTFLDNVGSIFAAVGP